MFEQYILNEKNFKLIMRTLYQHFKIKYDYDVGIGEEQLTKKVMDYYSKEYLAKQGQRPKEYIFKYNKLCLSELLKIISSKLRPTDNNIDVQEKLKPINTISKEQNKEVSHRFNDLSDLRQKIKEDNNSKKKQVPNFQNQNLDNNKDISNKFSELNNFRQEQQKKVENNLKNPIVPFQATGISQAVNPELSIEFKNAQPIEKADSKMTNSIDNFKDAPKSAGQKLIIEKPKDFENLANNTYKYNNNYIKTHHLVIDSRDRNIDNYPNSFEYSIDLDNIYKDLISIELISANIPKTEYLINSSNNLLHFIEDSGSELIATITPGNYTPTSLATEIETQLETSGGGSYTVSADSTTTNKFTITLDSGATTFDLLFDGGNETHETQTRTIYKDNSIGPIIGFSRTDVIGITTYTGDNQYNLNGPTYILLKIHNLDNLNGVQNKSINKSFAKIILDTNLTEYKYFKSQSDYITRKEFSPPLAKLAQLNISFVNYDNTFYDFGNLEHCLYFKIVTLNQNQGYFF
jgi:hypothetical protein